MKFSIKRIALIVVGLVLLFFVVRTIAHWDTIQRTMLGGVKVYETEPPTFPDDIARPAILVFSKTNGFRHEEAIPAANELFAKFANDNGWGYFQTENGATFSPDILKRFDAVIFNNTSGDVFTPEQREAFKGFLEQGGGFVGIHAAGDDSHEAWPWYMKNIVGTTFIGHPMGPQFQKARIDIEDRDHVAMVDLPEKWERIEEWYSFDRSPRGEPGVTILATIDEKTYDPGSLMGRELAMGDDHPVIWWRCVNQGRVFYSAMGHQAEAFAEPKHQQMLVNATKWALRQTGEGCSENVSEAAPAPGESE